jgi:pimeloyl-ACP methyl ester carboxylesterase
LDFIDALGLAQPLLAGHDWGARAAANAFGRRVEAGSHLVMLSVGYGTNDPQQKTTYAQAQNYWYHCVGAGKSLRERLNRLAETRLEEGYMARVERDGKDWLLIEDHCPICAAASTCQGFCRSELRLFQGIVGRDATVTREQYMQAGGSTVYLSHCAQ